MLSTRTSPVVEEVSVYDSLQGEKEQGHHGEGSP
jgi:hypothetical protein